MGGAHTDRPGLWLRIKALVVWLGARLLLASVRIRVLHGEHLRAARQAGRPIVYAFWHGRQLGLFKANPEPTLAVMTSLSRDGTLQSLVCGRFGLQVVRGSSSRAGLSGLLALSRKLRQGVAVGLAVDGPRGPVHQVKQGVVGLAQATGAQLVPITIGYRRKWELTRAWDRFQIPKPFTRATVVYGQPIPVAPRRSRADLAATAEQVGDCLRAMTAEADAPGPTD
jgi:lysophospholipid acyltransferase (LPLAT)-like uncharacterized protein